MLFLLQSTASNPQLAQFWTKGKALVIKRSNASFPHDTYIERRLRQPLIKRYDSLISDVKMVLASRDRRWQSTVVSHQSERFPSKWELPSLLSPFFITRGRMGARRAALILMKISLWKDTTVPSKTAQIFSKYRPKSSIYISPTLFRMSLVLIPVLSSFTKFWVPRSNFFPCTV